MDEPLLKANNTVLNSQPKYQNYLLVTLVLMLTATSIAAQQFKVPTIIIEVAQSLNMNSPSIPWLMSIFTFVGIFLALPTGGLAQKIGPKAVLIGAAICVAVGSIIGSFSTSGSMLILSRGIEGIGFIFATVAGPLAVARYVEPSKIGSAMGIWALWVSLGQILAFNLTPVLFGSMSWNNIWIVYAVISLVMAAVAQFVVKNSMGNPVSSDPVIRKSDIFSKKNLWLLCLAFCTFNIIFMAILSFAPLHLETSGLMTKSTAAFAATIPMILSIVSCPTFGKVSDKIGATKNLFLLAMLALGAAGVLMFSHSTALVYTGAFLLGAIGMGAPVMALTSLGKVIEPELSGIGMGLMMVFQNLGMFLGTLIFMPIVTLAGGKFLIGGLSLVPIAIIGIGFLLVAKFK